jgi:hypothetical protein
MNRTTRDLFPKTLVIKTSACLLKGNSAAMMKSEGATKTFPQNSIQNSMKSKCNTRRILLKSAEKLDGGGFRTNLLNWDKLLPS